MDTPQEPSVLAGLPAFDWDNDRAVRYEVAQEAIGQAVAAYTVLINQAAEQGDAAREAQLSEAQKACIDARNGLSSADATALDAVVSRYRTLIADLRAQAA
ncbi:hypothetical protein AMIS_12860 [Actinoplanes missouriensis 431]|uniref:Uncharacterized protein n=1 Tax=Actinoplanes missouriensis (strain ATCC 14538 / DSM 43046 / CBS 188.64 / JCM 3121 / NBRC 102363 / NCIMB 12654 / NRRL B-3342 / UNCC 431) TaxID=512565 RepID=I0H0G9_ACTM4|nr:hypothetical protein [Actinoplanes missouriensis]BAL86506.1 hypothetical protein AMIS_12860 [Actinoplanes missouriensis 431]